MKLALTGTLATFDPDPKRAVLEGGTVWIDGDGIAAVTAAGEAAPAGFADAIRLAAGGVVYPGLIDLHNHLAYNFLPVWKAPRDTPYTTRYQWPRAATYGRDISNPAQAMGIAAAAATLRYAEVKAAVGGVTAIQGSPPLTRAFPGWMVRNVEKQAGGRGRPKQPIYQSVLPATPAALRKYAGRMDKGSSFAYHLAEGTDASLLEEFKALDDAGCMQEHLIGIHSTALRPKELRAWGKRGGAVVWSPFSNLLLYGGTTDVLAARKAKLRVCLGADWAPSGTKSVLGELKVAALWNDTELGGALTSRDLCDMVTANPGDTLALAWGRQIGRLVAGGFADIAVLAARDPDPYTNLVRATERDVRFVAVGGRPVYGLGTLVRSAAAGSGVVPEPITVAGRRRVVVMQLPPELQPDDPDLVAQANQSWAGGLATMEAVRADPLGTVTRAQQRTRGGPEPLRFIPDMPGPEGGEARELTIDELRELVIPPLDALAHDRGFFDRIDRDAPPHAAILKDLRARFRA